MAENKTVYFNIADAKISNTKPGVRHFYVEGKVENGSFVPHSSILGEGDLAQSGQPGWFELTSGQFYPMHTARAPASPYVEGYLTTNGFMPSSREIK